LDDNGYNKLTNKMDGTFTITEMEVWEITGCIIEREYLQYNKEEINRTRT
jgi:hypothetical protein